MNNIDIPTEISKNVKFEFLGECAYIQCSQIEKVVFGINSSPPPIHLFINIVSASYIHECYRYIES